MRSIRLSLVFYLLVLLGLALGTVSALAHRNAERSLEAQEAARRELLQDRNQRECQKEKWALDNELIHQAWALADQAEIQFQGSGRTRFLGLVVPLGVLNAALDRNSSLVALLWCDQSRRNPYLDCIIHQFMTEIKFSEEFLHRGSEEPIVEYFQINTDGGKAWHSKSFGNNSLPFDSDTFNQTQLYKPQLGYVELAGVRLRHVALKVPIYRFLAFIQARPGGQSSPRRGLRESPARNAGGERPVRREGRAINIQCAAETTKRDARLAALKDALDQDLAVLRAESNDALVRLRNWFLIVGMAIFAACTLGGFFLVRIGLSPLQRLSLAVSKVSAKDFRLPFEERHLPSELRPIVDRLCQTLDLLKRAFAREKQAAADISHELRTPLAALLTTIEVGLRKPRSPDEYRELLADCHTTGQQMSHLVERLLALARLDAGVDQLRYQVTNVNALAQECADLVRPLADARGLELNVHEDGPAQALVDPNKLREILNNLLHNAIEYNLPHGKVVLSVAQHNGCLRLEVADSGIGIAPEARDRIFERFYRADASREATGLHAGLGLAIVKGYVDLMGGTISVQSTAGTGSTFRLELPLKKTGSCAPMLEKVSA